VSAGLPTLANTHVRKKTEPVVAIIRDQVQVLTDAGKSQNAIARELGVSPQSVRRALVGRSYARGSRPPPNVPDTEADTALVKASDALASAEAALASAKAAVTAANIEKIRCEGRFLLAQADLLAAEARERKN
jgi:transposase-like protein